MAQNANRNRCSSLSPGFWMTVVVFVFAGVVVAAIRDHNERYKQELSSQPLQNSKRMAEVRDRNERHMKDMLEHPERSPEHESLRGVDPEEFWEYARSMKLEVENGWAPSAEMKAYPEAWRRVAELLQQATELAEDKGYDGDEAAVAKINEWIDESIVLRIEHPQIEKENIDIQIAVLQLKRALLYANLRTDAVYRDPTRWDATEYIREM